MNKYIAVVAAIVVVGIFSANSYKAPDGFSFSSRNTSVPPLPFSIPSFPSLKIPMPGPEAEKEAAWSVWQNYLEFARQHDLAGIRNVSHQISATCNDPIRETECFALMDSVYAIGSTLSADALKYVYYDNRQIVMATDGPVVGTLFFTKTNNSYIKVLGLRLCFEDETSVEKCVKPESIKQDEDSNGWWNSVESLFYPS
ncbi:MAG: hypothetical protein Q8P21_01265 [bacterium]|nr:hypothetical protein [bacterium]